LNMCMNELNLSLFFLSLF